MSDRVFADSEAIYDYLLGFVNVEKGQKTEFKLDRMRELAASLGDPQESYLTVHVAGSKGKGSVSTMIARILEAAGHRTGLYTSPHILRWKERITLAGDEIEESSLIEAMRSLLPLVEGRAPSDFSGGELPTYFELSTLLAFEAFRLEACDRAVVETGLGGRLDSTNIVASAASVITPIELEHTEWLGDSIPRIAFEKAGIIKPGKPVCVAGQKTEAEAVFERVAAERGSPLFSVPALASIGVPEITLSGTRVDLEFRGGWPWPGRETFTAPLVGSIQAENMALALIAAALVEKDLDPETARRGLARASLSARFEILSRDPPLVIDGAHTPASVRLALDSFERLFPGPKLLLFACAIDKHHGEMAEILTPSFETVTITKPGSFKQSDPEAVYESFARVGTRVELIASPTEALASCLARARKEGLPLLVTGSFYLCAEVARALQG